MVDHLPQRTARRRRQRSCYAGDDHRASVRVAGERGQSEPILRARARLQLFDDAEEQGAQLGLGQSLIGTDDIEDEPTGRSRDDENGTGAVRECHLGEGENSGIVGIEIVVLDTPRTATIGIDDTVDIISDRGSELSCHRSSSPVMMFNVV